MRQAQAQRRQAVLLDPRSSRRRFWRGHRAGTSDRSRNRRCRAAATPRCRRRAPRLPRHGRRARPRTAPRRNAPFAARAPWRRGSCSRRSIRVIAALKSFALAGPARRENAGRAVERVDDKAQIVGEGGQLRGLCRRDRLDPRIGDKSYRRSPRARRGRAGRPRSPRRRAARLRRPPAEARRRGRPCHGLRRHRARSRRLVRARRRSRADAPRWDGRRAPSSAAHPYRVTIDGWDGRRAARGRTPRPPHAHAALRAPG